MSQESTLSYVNRPRSKLPAGSGIFGIHTEYIPSIPTSGVRLTDAGAAPLGFTRCSWPGTALALASPFLVVTVSSTQRPSYPPSGSRRVTLTHSQRLFAVPGRSLSAPPYPPIRAPRNREAPPLPETPFPRLVSSSLFSSRVLFLPPALPPRRNLFFSSPHPSPLPPHCHSLFCRESSSSTRYM